jgi:NAD(P)-dependent dehydrogenase (short-subunit alcohol dehydrogenase family)
MPNLVVVITGAATGLGRAAAMHLSFHGHRVIGGGFGLPDPGLPFETHSLDVRDNESVRDFIASVIKSAGRIDALINCAAIQLAGALEVMSIEETRQIIDTNLIGTMRLCREVLPHMRAQGGGRIINVSSLGGRIAFPFHTSYCSSKFAVEGLSECLQYEVRPFGIFVSVLAPGSFYTALAEKSECSVNAASDTIYAETMKRVIAANQADCRKMTDFLPFARKVEEILKRKKPKLRYFAGRPDQGFASVLRRFLPDSSIGWIVRKNFRIT